MKKDIQLKEAVRIAKELEEKLYKIGFNEVEIVGSIRRKEPIVGDIDIIVNGDMEAVDLLADEVIELGNEKATIIYNDYQVNFWYSPLESWGAAIFTYTGPKGYVIGYRKRAKEQGMTLNEKGLFKGDVMMAGETEESIYQALGKEFKQPEERGR